MPLLEDAAGALGARYRGAPCGGLGVLGCLSFHPRKIVTTGEGGAVTTNDAAIAERRAPAAQPRLALADGDADMPAPASTTASRTSSARSGIPQLRRLDELLAARERVADGLHRAARATCRRAAAADEGDVHGWQAYVIQVDRRDEALAALRAQGIEAQIGTYALHRLGAYRDQGAVPRRRRASSSGRSRCRSTRGLDRDAISTASRRLLTRL